MVTKKDEMLREVKENRYTKALFKYGIVPLTLLLDEYEQEGNFEECSIIFDAISFVNKHTFTVGGEKLPTKYSSSSLSELRSHFNLFGFKGDGAIANMPYYINEIKEMVK